MRHETARAYRRVGDIQEHLGNGPQAEAAQREGVALFEKLVTDFPGVPIYREDLIACRALLGWRMLWVPKPEEAIELRRRDLADWEKLAADFPTVPRYQQRIAYAHTDLANALNYPGRRYPEAENHYRQALTAWKKYQASFPKMPADRFGLAHSHMYLGAFLLGKGRFVEAGPELREGLALSKQLVVDNPGDFGLKLDLARALRYFGHWLRRTGKTHEAMKHCQEAIDIYEKHRNSFPDDAEALDKLGGSYGDVSAALLLLGRTEEAEAARRSSVAMYSKLVADHPGVNPYPNNLGRGQFHLGLLLYYNKNEQDAADVFRAARDVLEKLAKDRPGEPDHQIALGWLLANCPAPQFRDPGRAIELAKRALQRNPLDKGNWHLFGVANYRAGNWKGALEATQKSMELDNGGDGGQWIVLAVAHWQLGDKDEARKWYDKAAAWLKKSWPGDLQYHFAQREAAALLGVQERPAAKHKGKTPEQKDEPR
jgi:tetratricopeptide (TPR) repeat protein